MKPKIVLVVALVASWSWIAGDVLPVDATTPDTNGRIAFSMDLGLGPEIFAIKPSGLGIHQLTEVEGSAESPDWSPDGTRIVFHIVDQGLWMVNAVSCTRSWPQASSLRSCLTARISCTTAAIAPEARGSSS